MSTGGEAKAYPRDMVGYGQYTPDPLWPGGAKVALSFVVNYEEGGENCVLEGDEGSEYLLCEFTQPQLVGQRNVNFESVYEFGSRAGIWRLLRAFTDVDVPVTAFCVARALELNPEAAHAMQAAGWEMASHGYRWHDYQNYSPEAERAHIRKVNEIHEAVLGEQPRGFYQGKPNEGTRALMREHANFTYDNDAYNDDLPFWHTPTCGAEGKQDARGGAPHLIVPYTLETNDMKFAGGSAPGFSHARDFFLHLKTAFDELYEEGERGSPKMMTVGLHCRLVGRASRIRGLKWFLEYVLRKQGVWIARRGEIADHWYKHHYPTEALPKPAVLVQQEEARAQSGQGSGGLLTDTRHKWYHSKAVHVGLVSLCLLGLRYARVVSGGIRSSIFRKR